ncbi:hypothetical protein [Burkholderia sp. AU6039]|uniref:hypothetical protein n=1 Tax=Burkholderia sp. AU6039 TaxID=2015344 RepID=UPI00211B521A|nr:hypothetical protein [Burkholderia sp. AU6039]
MIVSTANRRLLPPPPRSTSGTSNHQPFNIIYDGPALAEYRMDVRDLAPALIAIADLFTSAIKELNGENAEVRLEVRGSFKAGAFHSARIFVQSLASQIRDLFAGLSAGGVQQRAGDPRCTRHHRRWRPDRPHRPSHGTTFKSQSEPKSYSSHIQRKYFQPLSIARPRSRVLSQ